MKCGCPILVAFYATGRGTSDKFLGGAGLQPYDSSSKMGFSPAVTEERDVSRLILTDLPPGHESF